MELLRNRNFPISFLFVLLLFPLHFCDYFYFLFCFFLTYFNSWYPCSTLAPLACSLMYYYCYYLLQSRVGHNILSSNDEIFCFPFISRPWLPFFSSLFFLLVLQCVSVYLVLLFFFFYHHHWRMWICSVSDIFGVLLWQLRVHSLSLLADRIVFSRHTQKYSMYKKFQI